MLMSVSMMNIRIVRMCVNDRLMPVWMRVWARVGHGRVVRTVQMTVMLIVHM